MAAAMVKYLWDNDHYVTQVDPDNMDCVKTHSCRDFVDYDVSTCASNPYHRQSSHAAD